MFGLIKKKFMELLISIVNGSSHTKCVSFGNQKCMNQSTPTNLHPNEYSQEFYYYTFPVKLDRYIVICNNLNDSSNKVCIPCKR